MSKGRIRSSQTKLLTRESDRRDARLFIIATEGQETEKQYFSLFGSPRIKVVVLPTLDNRSAPDYVLQRLKDFSQKYYLNDEDMLWLVLDVDRWKDKKLNLVCREAKQNGYHLAISNPCFEVWLWLHLDELVTEAKTCKDFEQQIRMRLGSYNKSNLELSVYRSNIADAIERAQTLHPDSQHYWPPEQGTHVYRVVEVILESLTR